MNAPHLISAHLAIHCQNLPIAPPKVTFGPILPPVVLSINVFLKKKKSEQKGIMTDHCANSTKAQVDEALSLLGLQSIGVS